MWDVGEDLGGKAPFLAGHRRECETAMKSPSYKAVGAHLRARLLLDVEQGVFCVCKHITRGQLSAESRLAAPTGSSETADLCCSNSQICQSNHCGSLRGSHLLVLLAGRDSRSWC